MRSGAALLAVATLAAASLAAADRSAAAGPEPLLSPVAIVVDTSGSMSESDGSPSGRIKINGAKVALLDFLQQIEAGTPIGLRAYPGSETETDSEGCSAGDALVPIQPRDPTGMAATIRTLSADGDTPTAAALKAAATELSSRTSGQATIVLVSDGESNCGQDPCEAAEEIAESGVDLQTITVGFRISGAGAKELQCIADQTGGRYLSVDDNEGLEDAFEEISRPTLHLEVTHPRRVIAQVGNDPSGLVRIEATVSNPSQQQARGAIARIRFDVAAGAPAVIRPVVYLGNLEPGDSRAVAWTFRPGLPREDRDSMRLPFTVLAGAQNTLADAEFEAAVTVADAYRDADEAGPILGDRRKIAIVGDSYSSGEGADLYLDGTDSDANPCHRSRRTYLVETFELSDDRILACSGAVTEDLHKPQEKRTVDAQIDQLTRLRDGDGVEAVVLTLGGNDVGFGVVAQSCLLGRKDCSRRIVPGVPFHQRHTEPVEDFVGPRLEAMHTSLQARYAEINGVVNAPEARAAGARPTPILVLAYPLPTPLTPQSCGAMLHLLSAAEMRYLVELGTRLNGVVETAVQSARGSGVPVFYVPNTEMAFQPDHTVCDDEPWVRSLTSFDGAGVDGQALADAVKKVTWKIGPLTIPNPVAAIKARLRLSAAKLRALVRGIQELAHPNATGYEAETRALLRWSRSPDAMAAVRFLEASSPASPPAPVTLESSGDDLGQLTSEPNPTLQGGGSYDLNLRRFAPESQIEIAVESELRVLARTSSDESGALAAQVEIPPDIEPGDHTLVVTGTGAGGKLRRVEIPFQVAGGGPPAAQTALLAAGAAGAAVTAILVGLLSFGGGRPRLEPGGDR